MLTATDPVTVLFEADSVEGRTKVLLADPDPISRHVLGGVLRTASGANGTLTLVSSADALAPIATWPRLDEADVVVLSIDPHESAIGVIRALVERDTRVVVLAARWDRHSLESAVAAGAMGCLVKDTDLAKVASAAHTVASGCVVLSPELTDIYRPTQAKGRAPADEPGVPLTEREVEVLELLAKGMTTSEVARTLHVSPSTIKSHVSHALPKLRARNRVEAILKLRRLS